MRFITLLLTLSLFIWADSWSVVISKECGKVSSSSLQNIYLKKLRFVGECRLVPLNLGVQNDV